VLVHDAARPLLGEDVIERVVTALGDGWDGAVPGLPLADTVKRADERGAVVETLDRTGLFAVQTPQAFVAPTLRQALAGAASGTYCAAFVEAAGGRVGIVDGDRRLVKITTSADLAYVESLLGE
jgi:2-C-methyl-D-erythritol 4-phosphate cytidylyltransferase